MIFTRLNSFVINPISKATKAFFNTKLYSSNNAYDVIIVGGGHAGCEAAYASARTGAKTCLVTQNITTIGELSCNPSIGGIGKGHLVREIDALGGVMGQVADEAGIHFRLLNRRKGPAVRGPRAQMDRDLYKEAMQFQICNTMNLNVVEGGVEDLLLDESINQVIPEPLAPLENQQQSHNARVRGVVLANGDEIESKCVVITTGTFLRGVLMIGKERYAGGRHLRDSEAVEPPSIGLAKTLEKYNFALDRLKTGTPPRLDGATIDYSKCTPQPSEVPAVPFSFIRQYNGIDVPNSHQFITCHKTSTNQKTHELVTKYAHLLPDYDGLDGKGNGPRYCPSIYKKVERFPERQGHNSFLEPEGLDCNIVYPNGMSGPYPQEIQLQIMQSMPGLEQVQIVRPGYDVEYDFVNPQLCITHTMQTKSIAGLFLAGQICGTTGYEEAAAQGIIAGINAGKAAFCARENITPPKPFIVNRDEGYIGVLIDDLVTKGTTEPYRMFTSRAEYRISLRADNADLRLTQKAIDYHVQIQEERLLALQMRQELITDRIELLKNFKLFVRDWATLGGETMTGDNAYSDKFLHTKKTAEEIMQRSHVSLDHVEQVIKQVKPQDFSTTPSSIYDTVEASIKYKHYVTRQEKDMESWRKAQGLTLPPDLEYSRKLFPTLSNEELEKLNLVRPRTLAEASSISGVTPHSLVYLYHYVLKTGKERDIQRRALIS